MYVCVLVCVYVCVLVCVYVCVYCYSLEREYEASERTPNTNYLKRKWKERQSTRTYSFSGKQSVLTHRDWYHSPNGKNGIMSGKYGRGKAFSAKPKRSAQGKFFLFRSCDGSPTDPAGDRRRGGASVEFGGGRAPCVGGRAGSLLT